MSVDLRAASERRVQDAFQSYLEGKVSLSWVKRTLEGREKAELERVVMANGQRFAETDRVRYVALLDAYDLL